MAALPTVAIDVVRAIFVEAAARGAAPPELCARFGVTVAELSDPNARVGVDRLRRIWVELPGELGVDDFGLAVARRVRETSALGVVGHVVRAAPTVGEGLRRALRFQELVSDAVVAEWREGKGAVEVTLRPRDAAFAPPRHAVELGVASLLLLVREASGRPLVPTRIAFRHARPASDAEARRVFGCPLAYGAEHDVVAFPRADLEVPLSTADAYLAGLLEERAEEMAEGLRDRASFAARARQAVTAALLDGEPTVGAVAARMRLSTRSLQRGLRDEGTSYQAMLADVRRDLAMRHLEAGRLTIQEIAFLLGFSEQSAFHHAFVRWTGKAPGEYRRTVRGRG